MRLFPFVLGLVIFIYACGGEHTPLAVNQTTEAISPVSIVNKGIYLCLSGKMGNETVTMHLYLLNNKCKGSYYNHSWERPKYLSGTYTQLDTFQIEVNEDHQDKNIKLWKQQDGYAGVMIDQKNQEKPIYFSLEKKSLEGDYIGELDSLKIAQKQIARFEFAAFLPTGNDKIASLIRDSIKNVLKMGNEMEGSMASVLKQTKALYFQTSREAVGKDTNDMGAFSSELIMDIKLFYQYKNWLIFSNDQYTYTGGAHGYGYTQFLNFDLETGKQLFLADIIAMDHEREVLKLLENKFRTDNQLSPAQPLTEGGLFDDRIPSLSPNFYLTSKGIYFEYAPYEIGPYAMGSIGIFLSFKQLKDYLLVKVPD